MKIGIFDPYLNTLSGGEKYMLTAASYLSRKHQVYVFWDDWDHIKKEAKTKLDIDLDKVKFTPNIFRQNYPKLLRIIQSKKFDLIIFLSDGSIPVVLTKLIIHFQFPVEWVKRDFKTKLKIKRARVVCNSQFTKTFIDRKFKIKSTVLYPPCDSKTPKVEKENIILHVGRFGKDLEGRNFKKQDVMIDAFKKLNIKNWRFVLVIGRTDEQKDEIQKLKDRAKGYPIEIVENPENSKLWNLYGRAKIYWHASGFGEDLKLYPEKAEHFGISTVEAMAAGCVPVVINAGGQVEIVENAKSGFLWNSISELLEKTEYLAVNKEKLIEMSKEAIKRSGEFSAKRFQKQLYEIIK